jgi:DNA repair protein RadB
MDIGCPPLDLLSRGLLEGSITQLFGEYATGKTSYCLQAAKAVSDAGRKTVYIDTENGFSAERAGQMGGTSLLRDIRVFNPDTLEEQTAIIRGLEGSLSDDVGLIVVDSLVSLYRVDATDTDKRVELIGDLSLQLLVLSRIARKRSIPIIVTNHVYEKFDSNELVPLGGNTVRYWSKVIIKLERKTNSRRKARLVRHPFLPEGRECYFALSDEGLVEIG